MNFPQNRMARLEKSDKFCESRLCALSWPVAEVNSWRPGTISKVALKANEGRWSDSVIFSFFFRTGSSWDGCLLKGSQDIAWYFQEWFGASCFWELVLLFSRGVNFQYVWREFWECDGCASSQLVRSNILQALFAAPLFKAFAFVIGKTLTWWTRWKSWDWCWISFAKAMK